jgi:peroxiredoxin Q/BCP
LFGVWALKKSFGREYYGIVRTTFLISQDGLITKVFRKVRPADHSEEVLKALYE